MSSIVDGLFLGYEGGLNPGASYTCQLFLNGLISIIVTAKIAFSSNRPYLFA